MYEKLIDTVSGIIKTYGEGIFDEPKFWYILTDSYSFGNDYALKAVYKKFWEEGLVDKIATCKGNPVKTREEINRIVEECKLKNPRREKEYATVLYSVAIALGTCTKKDYEEFINPQSATSTSSSSSNNQHSRSNTNPSPSPTPSQRKRTWPTQQKGYFLTHNEKWSIFWYVFWGVIIAFGSFFFYRAFFEGCPLAAIVITSGIIQSLYISCILEAVIKKNNNSDYYKVVLQSWVGPILILFCLSAVTSFFFYDEGIRKSLAYFFRSTTPESPFIITFFLCFFYVLFLILGSFGCFDKKNKKDPALPVFNEYIFVGFSLTLLGLCFFLFLFPLINQDKWLEKEKIRINQKYEAQLKTNQRLQEQRADESVELSFKGIKLGGLISESTTSQAIKELNNPTKEYIKLMLEGDTLPRDIFKLISLSFIKPTSDFSYPYYSVLAGLEICGRTILDNDSISVKIYEFDNRVVLITAKGYWSSGKFKELIKLYEGKYGTPERMTMDGLPFRENINKLREKRYSKDRMPTSENSDKEDYVWTYENGTIRISSQEIVYISSNFIKQLEKLNQDVKERKELRTQQYADSIREVMRKEKEIERKKAYEDSLRRVRNHENAIHEI